MPKAKTLDVCHLQSKRWPITVEILYSKISNRIWLSSAIMKLWVKT